MLVRYIRQSTFSASSNKQVHFAHRRYIPLLNLSAQVSTIPVLKIFARFFLGICDIYSVVYVFLKCKRAWACGLHPIFLLSDFLHGLLMYAVPNIMLAARLVATKKLAPATFYPVRNLNRITLLTFKFVFAAKRRRFGFNVTTNIAWICRRQFHFSKLEPASASRTASTVIHTPSAPTHAF